MAARVGLTGGIGSGKSTVAGLFSELGVLVIDADQVAREIVEPGTPCLSEIVKRYGSKILCMNGELDRKQLGEIVFSDRSEREWLEKLLHPEIRRHMDTLADQCANPFCILEIPLLIEGNRHRQMDHVIIVQCDKQVRIRRLMETRGMEAESILRIMDQQANDSQRITIADSLIDNSGGIEKLHTQVEQVFTLLLQKFPAP